MAMPATICSGFRAAFLPQQKLVDGLAFPKILHPQSVEDKPWLLTTLIRNKKAWLEEQLHLHGAILFRGFGLKTPHDFSAFVEAFGWDEFAYKGRAPRTQICNRVFTANEAPPEVEIFFHHEMCRMGVFPSKVFFFCEVPPLEGGQTPLIMSHILTKRVEEQFPDFVRNIEEKGLRYTYILSSSIDKSNIMGQSWQGTFKTQDQREAEKRAAEMDGKLEWLSDDTVKFVQGPYKSIRTFGERGRKSWFNTITGLYDPHGDAVTYGDGLPIPEDAVAGTARIEQEEAVDIEWQQGDVLVLDNHKVMHGRRRGKPPRRVLVSLCK